MGLAGAGGPTPQKDRRGEGRAGTGTATPDGRGGSRRRRRRWLGTEPAPGAVPLQGTYTPLSTPFLLAAGPFDRFTEVQAFQDALLRISRITQVRPLSFKEGRLELEITSQYTDAQTLVDSVTTSLAPYRPAVRGVSSDRVELGIREIPEPEDSSPVIRRATGPGWWPRRPPPACGP